jgi:hypothetical protein
MVLYNEKARPKPLHRFNFLPLYDFSAFYRNHHQIYIAGRQPWRKFMGINPASMGRHPFLDCSSFYNYNNVAPFIAFTMD